MTSTKYKCDILKGGYKDEWQRSCSKGSYILVEEIRHVTQGTKLEVVSSEEEVVWELTHSFNRYLLGANGAVDKTDMVPADESHGLC